MNRAAHAMKETTTMTFVQAGRVVVGSMKFWKAKTLLLVVSKGARRGRQGETGTEQNRAIRVYFRFRKVVLERSRSKVEL